MRQVEDKGYLYLTYFLNPREREILENVANGHFLKFFFSPKEAEYARVIIAPDYYESSLEDFEISLLEITYPNKFGSISHRQILGTFIHETGLQRREIGDIVTGNGKAQIYVNSKLRDYFLDKVKEINHLALRIKEIPLSERIEAEEKSETLTILASSMRLDKIISAGLTISRNLAVNMIQSKRIKVNYTEMERNDFTLQDGDLISIRGHGRIKILRQLGLSKKDKIKVEIEKIDNRKGR
ncbi:MAG: cell division protein [Streptococcaceae bacterium]|nr:cell division protein [Streptococcaceae bacterium]